MSAFKKSKYEIFYTHFKMPSPVAKYILFNMGGLLFIIITSRNLSFSMHWVMYSILELYINICLMLRVAFWLFAMC